MAVVPGSRSNLAAKELSEVLLRHCRTSLERCLETGVLREAKQLIWDSESAYRLAQWKGDSVLLLEVRIFEERLDDVIKCKCDEAFSKVHPQEQELNCLSKAAVKNFKKDVKRAFKKKSQLSHERLTSMLDDVMAEFSQKASPYLCSLRTNVGMCLSWELRTSAAKLLLASDHIIISCDFMSDCSEPQTLTAGSVGVVAKCDGSSAFVKLLCSGGLEECFICKHNFQYVSRHQLSDTAYAMYRFYASRKGLGFRV